MVHFLERLLEQTRFSTVSARPAFLPRKVGLGYALVAVRAPKGVLAPVRKALRELRRADEIRADEAHADKACAGDDGGSSEDVSKLAHILKKSRRS